MVVYGPERTRPLVAAGRAAGPETPRGDGPYDRAEPRRCSDADGIGDGGVANPPDSWRWRGSQPFSPFLATKRPSHRGHAGPAATGQGRWRVRGGCAPSPFPWR